MTEPKKTTPPLWEVLLTLLLGTTAFLFVLFFLMASIAILVTTTNAYIDALPRLTAPQNIAILLIIILCLVAALLCLKGLINVVKQTLRHLHLIAPDPEPQLSREDVANALIMFINTPDPSIDEVEEFLSEDFPHDELIKSVQADLKRICNRPRIEGSIDMPLTPDEIDQLQTSIAALRERQPRTAISDKK